ncbi:MAG: FkbM family methyltransferase [Candidatus Helarchaeota archaeon]
MQLPIYEKGIIWQILLFGKREPSATDFLIQSNFLKRGDVVLDIGANIGYYALLESKLVGSEGKVYAIEPVSSNYNLLKINIKLNKLINNIEAFHIAFGEKNETKTIYVSSVCNWSSLEKHENVEYLSQEKIRVKTVDSFLKNHEKPKLIRMDTEGYEYKILKGMKETLKEDIKLFIEIHGSILKKNEINEIIELLKFYGFKPKLAIWEYPVKENLLANWIKKKVNLIYPSIILKLNMSQLKHCLIEGKFLPLSPQIFFSKE